MMIGFMRMMTKINGQSLFLSYCQLHQWFQKCCPCSSYLYLYKGFIFDFSHICCLSYQQLQVSQSWGGHNVNYKYFQGSFDNQFFFGRQYICLFLQLIRDRWSFDLSDHLYMLLRFMENSNLQSMLMHGDQLQLSPLHFYQCGDKQFVRVIFIFNLYRKYMWTAGHQWYFYLYAYLSCSQKTQPHLSLIIFIDRPYRLALDFLFIYHVISQIQYFPSLHYAYCYHLHQHKLLAFLTSAINFYNVILVSLLFIFPSATVYLPHSVQLFYRSQQQSYAFGNIVANFLSYEDSYQMFFDGYHKLVPQLRYLHLHDRMTKMPLY